MLTFEQLRGKLATTAEMYGFACDVPATDKDLFISFKPERTIVDGYTYKKPYIVGVRSASTGMIKRYEVYTDRSGTFKPSEKDIFLHVFERACECVEQLNRLMSQYRDDLLEQIKAESTPQLSYTVTVLPDGKVRVMNNIDPKVKVEYYDYGDMDSEQKLFYGLARYLNYEEAELLNFDDVDTELLDMLKDNEEDE